MLEGESRITNVTCFGCRSRLTNRYLQDPRNVLHGSGWPAAMPILVRPGQRIENVSGGLDVTTDAERISWQPFASFPEMPVGLPKLGLAGADDTTIVYQTYGQGSSTSLLRIEHSAGNSTVVHPAMSGLASLVINRTAPNSWYAVYDADRWSGIRLIAIDEQQVRKTINGGESWAEIPGLADLVTHGEFRFRTELPDASIPLPLVTAISFSPVDQSQVLIGTVEGGIYYSGDHGTTWGKINGSEPATYVTSFFWADVNTVYVSTFGRGLWQL